MSEAAVKNEVTTTENTRRIVRTLKLGPLQTISTLDIILSIKHLSIMLKSSMAIEDTLKALVDQTANKKLKVVWGDILTNVQAGLSLSQSMEVYDDVFSNIIISIIRAGEEGGTLEKNLLYLADYIKKDYDLKKKVKGALFYPIFIMGFSSVELISFIFLVIPKLEPFFKSAKEIPAFTRMVMDFASFVRNNVIAIVVVGAVSAIGLMLFFRTQNGQKVKDNLVLKIPIIKLMTTQSVLANFSRTLGILLESGINLTQAINICSLTVGNYLYARVISKVHDNVKSGKNLADSLAEYPSFFPPTFTKLISVGEETSTLESNLLYLHEFYADEVNDMSNNLTTLLEPVLLVFIGLMIGGLAIALVVPIFQVTSTIGE